jgi:hypothetical protein
MNLTLRIVLASALSLLAPACIGSNDAEPTDEAPLAAMSEVCLASETMEPSADTVPSSDPLDFTAGCEVLDCSGLPTTTTAQQPKAEPKKLGEKLIVTNDSGEDVNVYLQQTIKTPGKPDQERLFKLTPSVGAGKKALMDTPVDLSGASLPKGSTQEIRMLAIGPTKSTWTVKTRPGAQVKPKGTDDFYDVYPVEVTPKPFVGK